MKKIITSLFLLFLVSLGLFLISDDVFALTDDEVVLVYVEAPEGWENPHLWTWNEAGDSAYAILGWPGKTMIEDQDNTGWFYLYVPKTMESAILSNGLDGDDASQTEAFDLVQNAMWVTIAPDVDDDSKLVAEVSETKATIGDLPDFVDTIYIFALVPIDWDDAAIWAWEHPSGNNVFPSATWPGTKMDVQSDGWFMLEVPASANKIIINDNNSVATEVIQTIDIDLLEGNNFVVVGEVLEDGKFDVDVTSEKPIIIEDGYIIHVTVPEEWEAPHAWAWSHPDGTNLYPSWPGEPLIFDEETNTWTLEIPDWVNRVIINNDIDGTMVQTIDLDIPEDGDEFNLIINGKDDEGKFLGTFEGSSIIPEPTPDETPNNNELWIIIGSVGSVLVIGLAVLFIILKKKR